MKRTSAIVGPRLFPADPRSEHVRRLIAGAQTRVAPLPPQARAARRQAAP